MCVSRSRFSSAQDRNGKAVFCVGPVKCCRCVADASCHKEHTQTTLCLVSLGLQENTLHFILFAFSLLQDMHLILQSQTAGVLVASLK